LVERLASVRLTLWLLALLVIAMAVASFIPQNASPEAYLHVLGTLLGSLVAKTALRDIYNSWWFIGAFVLLALNLLACVVRRSGQLLRQERQAPERVTRQDTTARAHRGQWRAAGAVDATAEALAAALRRRGYRMLFTAGEEAGQRGLVGRRGRLAPWVSVIVHVGMLAVLIGAGWGKLPSNGYRTTADLQSGETFPVRIGDEAFGIKLLDAGTKYSAKGQPSDYWAKLEVLEENQVVRSVMIRPNHPLRYHGVSVVLQSLTSGASAPGAAMELALEVTKGDSREQVPITITDEGAVDPMSSYRRLTNPAWMVIVTDLRMGDDSGKGGPQAKVMLDPGGPAVKGEMPKHEWQEVGWVGEEGKEVAGARLRLVHGAEAAPPAAAQPTAAVLSLDRDIGLPIVYAGFIIMALGVMLLLTSGRSSLVALVAKKGQGSQVFLGISRSASARDAEALLQQVQSEVGASRESEAALVDGGGGR
jgi:cytochrome c biogenesis protein